MREIEEYREYNIMSNLEILLIPLDRLNCEIFSGFPHYQKAKFSHYMTK